jgi:hypothetical protein
MRNVRNSIGKAGTSVTQKEKGMFITDITL